jgi:amidase
LATHHFVPTRYHTTIGSHDPVLHIAAGDTVCTTTVDAAGRDARGTQITPRGNPQTGPFYIDDAAPGDTLVLALERIDPNRDTGWSSTVLAPNVVDPAFVHTVPEPLEADWRIDHAGRTATLLTPATALGTYTVPLAPMLGCFGVAPPGGQAISTATSAEHGGNMDYRGFAARVTVYLPVFVPGALLHLGDGHAVQGDGEIAGTGIEVSCDVQFSVRLRKGALIHWPRGENAREIFTVGNARPLDQALQHATTEMCHWLRDDFGLDERALGLLLGQGVEYAVGNVFDPAYTMVCKMPTRLLQAASARDRRG